MRPTRVLLADDHVLFRAGIRALLEKVPDVDVIGEASTGREALHFLQAQQPDLVLMEIPMPELNGLDATAYIAAQFPNVRVIILSMHAAEEYVLRALRAGASGYLFKNSHPVELALAVKAVMDGKSFLSSAVTKHAIDAYIDQVSGQCSALKCITPRQRCVLQLVAEGNCTKQIARKLKLSGRTVEMHRSHLMATLDIHDVPGLVRYAVRAGMISAV